MKLLDRYTNRKAANGTLYLTATHLIYVEASAEVRKETWVCCDTWSLFGHRFKNYFISHVQNEQVYEFQSCSGLLYHFGTKCVTETAVLEGN